MKTEIIMSWRNLWRNKRRTWTMISSIFFGVLICCFMTGMQEGMYSSMINNTVDKYLGYYQIQDKDYWEEKIINNTFEFTSLELKKWTNEDIYLVPKLDSYALLSFKEKSRPVMIKGVDFVREKKMISLDKQLQHGEMISNDSEGIMIGSALFRYLKAEIGDSLVFIGQGYHGQSAAALLPIKGVVKDPIPSVDKRIVYMPLPLAQNFFSAPNRVTSVAVLKDRDMDGERIKQGLVPQLGDDLALMRWDELQPELIQQIEGDRIGGDMIKIILFVVIGFGLLGTVTMMVAERKRELGIMISVGMARKKLARILIYESFIMTFIGVLLGTLASYIVLTYFVDNPIPMTGDMRQMVLELGWEPVMKFSNDILLIVKQGSVLVIMMVLISIYPWYSVMRLKEHLAVREQ